MGTKLTSSENLKEFQDILNPRSVAQFLATEKWSCHTDKEFAQLWVAPTDLNSAVHTVVLPRDQSYADFNKRWTEAIRNISSFFGYRLADLAEKVSAVHADLFFVRIDQSSTDGTIPLHQAANLLQNIDVMIRSAAIATHNPLHSGRGRIPDSVKDFLSDEIRMGHTKKGSFIITVAARLDDDAIVPHAPKPLAAPAPGEAVDGNPEIVPITSFTRQVMTTLSRTLDATQKHVAKGDDYVELAEAVRLGLRLPLVEALTSIGKSEGLKSVDMSFEWAASEPADESLPVHVKLSRKHLSKLPKVEEKLRTIEPRSSELVSGQVVELKRSEEDNLTSDWGEVVIRAEIDGKWRKVTVPLEGTNYEWAIHAHRAKLPYSVTGVLGKKGNSWHLLDDVVPDVSSIVKYFDERGHTVISDS